MPHALSVNKLSEMCVDFIKDNMGEFCKMSALRRPTGVDAFNSENSQSPFDSLPSVILEGIIRHLTQNNQLKEQYLELLITPHLRTLDFSMCDKNSISGLLRLASRKCPHLRSLWLGRLGYFLGCLNFIPKFTHLQVLDISGSATADSLLHLLGTYCADLRELHIDDSMVSDAGIHGLCVIGKCKSIQILNLNETNVTCIGTTMALKNLPVLKELRHDSIVETLAYLHRSALREEDVPTDTKYSLSALSIRFSSPYVKGNLSEAVSLCPSLSKVEIKTPDSFRNRDLLDLLPMEKLCDLTISGTRTSQVSFDVGVAPLLRKSSIGNSLKSLSLCNFSKVNVRIITEHCPNLRFLSLDKNERLMELYNADERLAYQRNNQLAAPQKLKKLETLKICSCNCASNLLLLLSSPSLVSVTLENCYALTDDVLQKAADLDTFQNLEHFEVISNHRISFRGIDALMRENNPLKVIKLKDCSNVTDTNLEDWKKLIRDENWQLSITKHGRF